jgi:hypothetical protein
VEMSRKFGLLWNNLGDDVSLGVEGKVNSESISGDSSSF